MPVWYSGASQAGQGQFVLGPPGGLAGYRAAQAALTASGRPLKVWLHGHSIMSGVGTTTQSTDALHWLLRTFLVNKYGRSADYFPVSQSQNAHDFGAGYTWPGSAGAPPPWLIQVAPYGYEIGTPRLGPLGVASLSYGGMGGDATWINPTAVPIATFQHASATWLETCRAYDLVAPNITAGTPMSYNVNGAGAVNVTLAADGRIQVIPMATGLTAGRYNTVIAGVGATGQPWLSGVVAHATTRGAPGVQVAHIAASSSTIYDYDANYLDKTLLARDAASGVVGSGAFPMAPDLVICDYIGIASSADISPEELFRRMADYIECLRRANPFCDFIFITEQTPNPVTTDGTFPPDLYTLPAPLFASAARDLAATYGCIWINVHGAWMGRAVANGYTTALDIHPTTAGAADIASRVYPFL